MNYQNYTPLDFVKDENFQQWVKNPDEKSDFYWESWMQNHEDKKHVLLEAREILMSISFPTPKVSQADIAEIFEKVIKEEKPISIEISEERNKRRDLIIRRVMGIAASLLIFVTFSLVLYTLYQSPVEIQESYIQEETIKQNPVGRKSTFHLPDGSIVKLNAASELRISSDFGGDYREVYLEGEAYFEVVKNLQKPFIVHTGDLSTIVTGTAFNVNAYQENEDIKVAVFEGSVNTIVYHKNGVDTLSLLKSDMAVYNKYSSIFAKKYFDYIEALGWKDGVILFRDASSEEIFSYLERWYGVEIYVKDQEKMPESFVGEFKKETLENVLNIIGHALQFDYYFDDDKVFIEPKKNEYE